MNNHDMRVFVIADDLTGACDVGVQFAACSPAAIVWLDWGSAVPATDDVAIFTTESRNLQPAEAAAAVSRVCEVFSPTARQLIYKKIDSTMRGNIGTELSAAMSTCRRTRAVVCPAFPQMKRVVEDGRLRVLEASAIEVDIARQLRDQGVAGVRQLPLSEFEGADLDEGITIVDASTDSDLDRIASCALALEPPLLFCGSAGLARALASRLGPVGNASSASVVSAGAAAVLLIMGTTHPATQEQLQYFIRAAGAARVEPMAPLPQIRSAVESGTDVVIDLNWDRMERRGFTQWCHDLLQMTAAPLFVSGGDTVSLVCDILQVKGIRLRSEILPGIPYGVLMGGPAEGKIIVTKSGGFGERDAIMRAVTVVKRAAKRQP
ncbi:MAG TPA: four-carbon acid sugar kinase family protein [Acidobacteriota bacterium]